MSFTFVGGVQMFMKVITGGLIMLEAESSETIGGSRQRSKTREE
jgi:hypothetical protein